MAEEAEKLRVDEVEVVDDGPEEGEIVDESDDTASYLGKEIKPKHPLENSWTFWFDNPMAKSRQAAWGSSLRELYTFSTVEDFWGVYNNINHPSKLVVGADFHCFKHKIEPKWEDPVCANGGNWTMSFSKGKSDTSWLYTLLAMIGHQFDHGEEICGAVVSVRNKGDKIALWTKNAANETAQVSIGKQWKEFLDYSNSIGFIFHDDSMRLGRGAKNRYTV
uniref:eIF-4F 25 kDa subunit n=1 Tax=Nicotiana tabacum TaxID=4097 RepID=A0A1J0FAS9_TOBAC|nr:eIF4E1a [Nicotiana tabacum]QNT12786.1 eukaryotic translation initiation factor 4E1-S [Nicotiana tabacum]UVX95297.1 eukaryotic translation initiation factor 4E1-S [Nicotiana tabacum]